jgi:hypothetical protein
MCRLFCADLFERVLVKRYEGDRANEVLAMDWSLNYFMVLFQQRRSLPLYLGGTRFEF